MLGKLTNGDLFAQGAPDYKEWLHKRHSWVRLLSLNWNIVLLLKHMLLRVLVMWHLIL